MVDKQDIRWRQRLANFERALLQLGKAVSLAKERNLTELEVQGLIQAFEFSHELAWNVMKDYFEYQGGAILITGSRDATREAFAKGLITDGTAWMEMLKSRNLTSHTYNEDIAIDIAQKITNSYYSLMSDFANKMTDLKSR